jgi:pentalenene oxygenase
MPEPPGGGVGGYAGRRNALTGDQVPDPLTFDPDRWLDEDQNLPAGAFLPFGAGKHKCIGDRFALTVLITAIATIIRRVRLELAPGQTVRPIARATVRRQTLMMTVRPRREGTHRAA